jgi:hypothetical protein
MGNYQGDDTTGFQSPAQDYIEPVINMADILDLRRPGIYPVRGRWTRTCGLAAFTRGHSHRQRRLGAVAGKVCVALLHGEFILASLVRDRGEWWLRPIQAVRRSRSMRCRNLGDDKSARANEGVSHVRADRRQQLLLLL